MAVDAKKLMSDVKFYESYSRWIPEKGRKETWEEAVERVMNMHREYYAEKMTPELEILIDFAEKHYKEKHILGSQRALQFGGKQLLDHQARLYNCFGSKQSFVTSSGMKSFQDFKDGEEITVLTHTGKWQRATVRSYGTQKLDLVTFTKQKASKEVLVTSNHRWLLSNGEETTSLEEGMEILAPSNTFDGFDYEQATPDERLYWCYGMVYGDGTLVKNNGVHSYSMIRLCGTDKQFSERFEEMGFKTSTNLSLNGDFMAYTGTYLKTLPDPEVDSPNLIRAFVAGYLQADGEKGKGTSSKYVTIQSSDEGGIEFIRNCFPIAGCSILSETDLTGQVTNFGVRPKTIRFRINDNITNHKGTGWRVARISETDIEEKVWCLEVEEDHSFILEGGIVTGNCTVSHADRPAFFNEAMYLLLCGAGVGFSVQQRHISQLPDIRPRDPSEVKVFTIPDSIEGWADSFAVLLSSYFVENQVFPEYGGCKVVFDFSKIRPKGALISGGFKAPGPEPLRNSIEKVEALLESAVYTQDRLRPIQVYDIVMHMADAVIAGGVRRSATICLFDLDDQEMLSAKTGNWRETNPQRGRSNNSVMIDRATITEEQFMSVFDSIKQWGEPGFVFTDNLDFLYNPCVEIGMYPRTEDGRSGFEFCNLCEINGSYCTTPKHLYEACKAASILGTLQAGYTDFKYLSKESKEIADREALLGVSITGWMNNPANLFNPDVMAKGAEIVKGINKVVAELIGIRQAARTTCVKPSGNASVLLGTASGIHGDHAPRYIRHVQMNKDTDIAKILEETNPGLLEESVWSANKTDYVVAFPIISPEGSIYKKDLYGVKQLEYVKKAQRVWVEQGTNEHISTIKELRHNVSNTISVDDWDSVSKYVWENRQWFAGISFVGIWGDKDYPQAPFTQVHTPEEILEMYGPASLFASGLLVSGIDVFGELWKACDYVLMTKEEVFEALGSPSHENVLQYDFIRRARKFARNYFDGDTKKMTYCLKDVYNLHKWEKVTRSIKKVNWEKEMTKETFVDADTMGAVACSGNQCELKF